MGISANERRILELIAAGHSYDQILSATPGTSYMTIFQAAQSALDELEAPSYKVDEVRQSHPNAYRAWNEREEAELHRRALRGEEPEVIADALGRTRGAVTSRMAKMFIQETSAL